MHHGFVLVNRVGLALRIAEVRIFRVKHPRISDGILYPVIVKHSVERYSAHAIIFRDLRHGNCVLAVQNAVVVFRLYLKESIFFLELPTLVLLVRKCGE